VDAYTVTNIMELEDSAVRFGLSPTLEARFARGALDCDQVGLSYQRLIPGGRSSFFHRHHGDEEVYVVTAGSGRMRLGGEEVDIRRWDAIRVAPSTVRAFAAGPEGLEILAFGTHREDDGEILPADWGDE
jgi:uncharacterized cupin superfamily protein